MQLVTVALSSQQQTWLWLTRGKTCLASKAYHCLDLAGGTNCSDTLSADTFSDVEIWHTCRWCMGRSSRAAASLPLLLQMHEHNDEGMWAYVVQHEEVKHAIAQLGGVGSYWCHHSFPAGSQCRGKLTCIGTWSKIKSPSLRSFKSATTHTNLSTCCTTLCVAG